MSGSGCRRGCRSRSIGTLTFRISPPTRSISDRKERNAAIPALRSECVQQGRLRRRAFEYFRVFAVDRRAGGIGAAVRRRQAVVRGDEGCGRSDLNACSKDDFVAALSNIFEYSPWIAEQAASVRPFAGVKPLFEAMKVAVDPI